MSLELRWLKGRLQYREYETHNAELNPGTEVDLHWKAVKYTSDWKDVPQVEDDISMQETKVVELAIKIIKADLERMTKKYNDMRSKYLRVLKHCTCNGVTHSSNLAFIDCAVHNPEVTPHDTDV